MISVIQHQFDLSLQTSVDAVGSLCKLCIDRFERDSTNLPSFGDPEIDRQVRLYADGLADWIVGSLHWSFESERYFGKYGKKVRETRQVELLPPRKKQTQQIYQIGTPFTIHTLL